MSIFSDKDELKVLRSIEKDFHELVHLLRQFLHQHRAVRATLRIYNTKGELLMPANLVVGQTAQAVFTEFDANNNPVAPVGTVTFNSSDNTLATVDATGLVTAVAAGTVTITGDDPGNNLSASDTATITGASGVAVSATLVITPNAAPQAKKSNRLPG